MFAQLYHNNTLMIKRILREDITKILKNNYSPEGLAIQILLYLNNEGKLFLDANKHFDNDPLFIEILNNKEELESHISLYRTSLINQEKKVRKSIEPFEFGDI